MSYYKKNKNKNKNTYKHNYYLTNATNTTPNIIIVSSQYYNNLPKEANLNTQTNIH